MAIPGYKILRKIQQGGMSTVYLAVQKSIQREVALKVMSPALNSDPDFSRRFYNEAKITGHLSHPNIVTVYDIGVHKQYQYIAMDYLSGEALKSKIENGLSLKSAFRVIKEIASALDHAHQQGYIHRDVKPDNILFRADGSSVLCDFGIAKALTNTVKLTNLGKVLGTPYYMSPEQTRGKDIDNRSDIYSLGCVAYEMLTGKPPYSGDEPIAVAVKHITSNIPRLGDELKKYQPLINKLMAKKPEKRYQSGLEIIHAIDEIESEKYGSIRHSLTKTLSVTTSNSNKLIPLVSAFTRTFIATFLMTMKKVFSNRISFSKDSMQLDEKHLADIDDFVLDVNSSERYKKHSIMLASKANHRWVYWPIGFITMALSSFIYLDTTEPDHVRQFYTLIAHDKNLAENNGNIDHYFAADRNSSNSEKHKIITNSASLERMNSPERMNSLERKNNLTNQQAITTVNNSPSQHLLPLSTDEFKQIVQSTFSINITTIPSSATIRIVNIKPKYSPELKLVSGAYHLEISADNYKTKKLWLKVNDKNISRTVTLDLLRKSFIAGTNIVDPLTNGGVGPDMIVLPHETIFIENKKGKNERQLSLPSPVAVSSHEVSFVQYDAFANSTERSLPRDYSWGRENRPVVGITQQDAIAYAKWLSAQTGYTYRLPTKNEWEFAARSGKNKRFWWDEKSTKKMANCRSGCKSKWSKLFRSSTAPIGNYPANLYGLYDTAGNVAEWLSDCDNSNDEFIDLVETHACEQAIIAGGSHQDSAKSIHRSTFKSINAMKPSKAVGFRLLLEL